MVYYNDNELIIRNMEEADARILTDPATTIASMAKVYVSEGKAPQVTLSDSSQQLFDIMVGLVDYGRSLVPGRGVPVDSR